MYSFKYVSYIFIHMGGFHLTIKLWPKSVLCWKCHLFKEPRPLSKKAKLMIKKHKTTPKQPQIVLTLCSKNLGSCQKVLNESISHPRISSQCPKSQNRLEPCGWGGGGGDYSQKLENMWVKIRGVMYSLWDKNYNFIGSNIRLMIFLKPSYN